MADFAGFPAAALDFYDDLETDNTRSFWEAHRAVYESAVKAPMLALTAALEPEFGPAKVFRPYRDVRFAADKTPYKTSQGAVVQTSSGAGYYVQVGGPGVMVGVGLYHASSDELGRFRAAVSGQTGAELQSRVERLVEKGWEVGGDRLKTSPRGYDAAHPRIGLLRHRSLILSRSYGFEPVIHTSELLGLVRRDWRAGRPLLEWVGTHVS